ncbi:MAG: type III-A CRISPR-associated protein Cas10/Csm1 [Lachnospiraceae bacterium]|nr:type III-A CRISPR-associated protein Cas10/Csm1 [Lachnospiraceae bacterium]
MTEKQIKLTIGSLLHDIGKVVYRSGDGRNHSQSGFQYLKETADIQDSEILNCVRFHHGANLSAADLADDAPAYITYFADNIAAAADRREGLEKEDGFDKKVPLSSIFNLLNGNSGKYHFAQQVLDVKTGINYPTDRAVTMDEGFYKKIISNITDNLKGISLTGEYVNSLLEILEANLTYIPSSTSRREQADISLYDHSKMTAAIAQCIDQYLEEQGEKNYRRKLFVDAQQSYSEKMFLLYSMDISGIQNFIYTIVSKKALKGLRARSFYLEIMMEHIIDELLDALSLSRANLIYSGGGHCYLLLPHTEHIKQLVDEREKRTNTWLLNTFGISLYIAGGYAPCSANDLKNMPDGSYSALYEQVSSIISRKKAHRYSAQQIMMLNRQKHQGERECEVCRRAAVVDEENRCPVCAALEKMSWSILHQKFFTVICDDEPDSLPLPGGRYLVADDEKSLLKRMEQDSYVRTYTKNESYTGKRIATKLWIGDYTTDDSFEELAQKAEGIERIGILRADVDNLGQTFVRGFQRPDGDNRYVTLSRTATLSRQLSLFFKCYINQLLKNGEENRFGIAGSRNVVIVYSGGDDVFLAGAWNDVIEAFIDLRNALNRFTQGTLTISGGIGLYHSGYPVNAMAKEVEILENLSKKGKKNAITLFDQDGTYGWDVFLNSVMGEKFREIQSFFEVSEDRGKAFLYHLLELLRNHKERINRARYVYLLSRMEPDRSASREQKEAYQHFSQKMYEWFRSPEDRRQVITAIYLYVYLKREREEV